MDTNHLGMLIKLQREKMNLTQENLANGICSRKALYKYEKGISIPSFDIVLQFASKLGSDFLEILSFSNISDPITMYHTFNELQNLYENKNFEQLYIKTNSVINSDISLSVSQRQQLLWYTGIYYGHVLKDFEKSRNVFCNAISLNENKQTPDCLDGFCTTIELHICNSYGASLNFQKKYSQAIDIFKMLKENIEYHRVNVDDVLYLKVLYNLAKCYNSAMKPDHALAITKLGIKKAQEKWLLRSLSELHLESANAYILKGDHTMRDRSIKHFIYLYELTGNAKVVERKKEELIKEYDIEFFEYFEK